MAVINSITAPRFVLAAPQGRSGKTTVALGICSALAERNLRIQPFKKGPDYIDPSWLSAAAGRMCRSLDPFFLTTPIKIIQSFIEGSLGADICLIEGNHGLYDSLDEEGTGSTAAVARELSAPVILVVNTERMSRSVAAMVYGYQSFEPETKIAAVILNNVAQVRHENKLRNAVERYCNIPVVGALPRDEAMIIPDRHLGLIPQSEETYLLPVLEICKQNALRYLDLDTILDIARSAVDLHYETTQETGKIQEIQDEGKGEDHNQVVIGVIRDRAFSFYYPENLEALEKAGACLVYIDSLQHTDLPDIDTLYIGGGFPEVFMEALEANVSLREQIRGAVERGLPIYAECGGLMYLSKRLKWGERSAEMVGVLPFEVMMYDRPQGHGYVVAETNLGNPFFPPGVKLRGHEFHHSQLLGLNGNLTTAYRLLRGKGLGLNKDGIVYRNVLASYTHLHASGSPGWAESLVRKAKNYAEARADG
jgi:cobyrinic acid a,c-diamide synthase